MNTIFKLSQKDINFIKPLWKWLNIFLVTPCYDFDKNVTKYWVLSKLYGSVFILARIIWIGALMKDEAVIKMWSPLIFTKKFSYIFSVIHLIALNSLTNIKSSFGVNINAWKILFTNFQHIDIKLQNKDKVEKTIWKNFYFAFSTKLLIFTVFAFYALHSWSNFLKISYLQGLWTSPICDVFYEFQIFVFITSIVQCIKIRYQMLNAKLITINKSPKMIEELKQLIPMYQILGETIQIFNKLFGYEILLIFFHTGMQLVACVNFPLASLDTIDLKIYLIICNIVYLIIFLVRTK